MKRVLWALAAATTIIAIGGGAVEARTNLNGTYAFTSTRSCTTTNGPDFIPDGSGGFIINDGGFFRQIATDSGTTTYNSDGTGMTTNRSVTMNISAGSGVSIVSISQSSATFTYTIENDNQLVTNFDAGTFETIAGAGTGNIGTFSARPARQAQIGNGANTIVSGPAEDILDETLTFISGPSKGLVQHRVCTRSSISVKQ